MLVDRGFRRMVAIVGPDHQDLADFYILKARIAIAEHHPRDAVALARKVGPGLGFSESRIVLAEALDLVHDAVGARAARAAALAEIDKIGPGAVPEQRAELAGGH